MTVDADSGQTAMAAIVLGRERRAWMIRVYEALPELDLQDIDPQEADWIVEALSLGQDRVMQETESANALDRSELGGVKLPEPVLVAGSIQSRILRCRELRDRASTRVDRGVIRIEGIIVADCHFTGRVDERLLGVIISGLISQDKIRRARQVVTPSLWQEEHVQA